MEKNTIIVNLFAGPGAGKSTGAAFIFSSLKMLGIDSEYVSEFAKDKVWEQNGEVFKCQFYVTGKQIFKISRCYKKVDVIVTDSPINLGALYADTEELKKAIVAENKKYNKNEINIFLNRVKEYNPNGRHQNEDEAKKIDENTKKFLTENDIPFICVNGDKEGYEEVVRIVQEKLKNL